MMKSKVNIFWFRRDLRIEDNVGLSKALDDNLPVVLLFIFDQNILDQLENKYDRRVDYIYQALKDLNQKLQSFHSSILIKKGKPLDIFLNLKDKYDIQKIYCNEDYEPYAIKRDDEIESNFNLLRFKDHVMFRFDEILKKDNSPYTVYTPYSKQWKLKLTETSLNNLPLNTNNLNESNFDFPSLDSLGFNETACNFQRPVINKQIIKNYKETRDIPSLDATSKLSIALRFGTISIRSCVKYALENNATTWLNELIWRDFFIQILAHFPKSANQAYKIKYENIQWRNNEDEFLAWCEGNTGYPIVDAGMRELNETGFMHNRVRMIVASFLCKHLLIDWRWGETYFANKLNDYEQASNVGNWQWAASCGCDAVPYFRVFNPTLQQEKFDPDFTYIKKWIPGFKLDTYLKPIVDHPFARERAIETYKKGINRFEN